MNTKITAMLTQDNPSNARLFVRGMCVVITVAILIAVVIYAATSINLDSPHHAPTVSVPYTLICQQPSGRCIGEAP